MTKQEKAHVELVTTVVDALSEIHLEVVGEPLHDDDALNLATDLAEIGIATSNRAALIAYLVNGSSLECAEIEEIVDRLIRVITGEYPVLTKKEAKKAVATLLATASDETLVAIAVGRVNAKMIARDLVNERGKVNPAIFKMAVRATR
jgi:hypothetical protein